LPGVTRAWVLRAATALGIPVKEVPLAVDTLADATEAFVTNSVQGVIPVRSLAGSPGNWPPGPVAERLRAARTPSPLAASGGKRAVVGRDVRRNLAQSRGSRPLIILVDNYDSFTYNLAHLLLGGGCEVEVVRNDEVAAGQIASLRPDGVVISPGPCA